MRKIHAAVYILASQRNGTLYIGVTSDLIKRVWQHKESLTDGFTSKYGIKRLVWYEFHESMLSAIELRLNLVPVLLRVLSYI